jgi:hypothetical protein
MFSVGGLLRAAYALMFEDSVETAIEQKDTKYFQNQAAPREISAPAANLYSSPTSGKWRETNELTPEPASVIDSTTKLLERDQ